MEKTEGRIETLFHEKDFVSHNNDNVNEVAVKPESALLSGVKGVIRDI